MDTPLWILTGIQSLQNNLLGPQERWFSCKIFYKSCRSVGTRFSFLVRWFVSFTLFRICCASNIPNTKVSMDQSPPHIRPVLLISFSASRIKSLSWSWEQEQEVWGLIYLHQKHMSFFIMIGTHSWGQLFTSSVRSDNSRGRHLLAYWGSPVSRVSWASRRSWASPASPAAFAYRAFCASRAFQEYRGSWNYGGSWVCGWYLASWVSSALILGVWSLFQFFALTPPQHKKTGLHADILFSCDWPFG